MSMITSQDKAAFQNYFKAQLKELKKAEKGSARGEAASGLKELNERIGAELKDAIKAVASRSGDVQLSGKTFKVGILRKNEIKPLIELANKFFSTKHEGLLTFDLLDDLRHIKYQTNDLSVDKIVRNLVLNNEPISDPNENQGVNKVQEKLEKIKDTIRYFRKATMITTAIAVPVVLLSLALIPIFVPVALAMGFAGLSLGIANIYAFTQVSRAAEKDQEYWAYVHVYSKSNAFQDYKKQFEGIKNLDMTSLDFLEAAALRHKLLDLLTDGFNKQGHAEYMRCGARLWELSGILGNEFSRINWSKGSPKKI